ncbi:hypothetical protein BTIS_1026 [Bifidobacterium tissieri]|uniref:Uncharacterized protein n=1 Tax=Bifidobacterium tissieri TaxID=1630162 RepID=A0A261FFJ3_9BIFI|nr:hypothetical protein [Bifidobacterium tissieri]OZG57785.1 hypothetical protein BTIS_1026 [Bifidobacterium tissieri]
MCGYLRKAVASVVSVVFLFFGFAGIANAKDMTGATAATVHVQDSGNLPSAAEVQKIQAALPNGGYEYIGSIDGFDIYAQKDPQGESSLRALPEGWTPDNGDEPQAYGACTVAVTAAVFGLGAAVIGLAATAGGLWVAGVFLSPQVLGLLAGAMGSYSAVEAIIAEFVC